LFFNKLNPAADKLPAIVSGVIFIFYAGHLLCPVNFILSYLNLIMLNLIFTQIRKSYIILLCLEKEKSGLL